MVNGREIGLLGEKIAGQYLKNSGYAILQFNYRDRCGEIDIIAIDQDKILTFFEVKTRTSGKFGSPEESVTAKKQLKILKTVDSFIKENAVFLYHKYHIDVISVQLNFLTRKARIKHIKNAISDISFEGE